MKAVSHESREIRASLRLAALGHPVKFDKPNGREPGYLSIEQFNRVKPNNSFAEEAQRPNTVTPLMPTPDHPMPGVGGWGRPRANLVGTNWLVES